MKMPRKRANPFVVCSASFGIAVTVFSLSFALLPNRKALAEDQPYQPSYVAFGDSITTGGSVPTCRPDRQRSPWGCTVSPPPATPYPDLVARGMGWTYSSRVADYRNGFNPRFGLYRAGIWGYTVQEAVAAFERGRNDEGNWITQLRAVSKATRLVTGSLGINDMHFSDVAKWAALYATPGKGDAVTKEVKAILASRSGDFDKLFEILGQAQKQGVKVVFGLYYNPYDSSDPMCGSLASISNRIIDTLDSELARRANDARISVVDFRPAFRGHGAGSRHSYVFAKSCSLIDAGKALAPKWMGGGGGKEALGVVFDPHPNSFGTAAMAQAILGGTDNAD